jgi:hypothetical protein
VDPGLYGFENLTGNGMSKPSKCLPTTIRAVIPVEKAMGGKREYRYAARRQSGSDPGLAEEVFIDVPHSRG